MIATVLSEPVTTVQKAPWSAPTLQRGLTRSLDATKEGLAMDATQTCSIDGCSRPVLVRKRRWCSAHFQRWQQYGDPTGGGPLRRDSEPMLASNGLCLCGCGGTPTPGRSFIHGHHSRCSEYQTAAADFDQSYEVTESGCWQWLRINAGDDGYGAFWMDGRKVKAHRYSYERANGPIAGRVHIDHLCHDPRTCSGGTTCRHRACVNPDHLAVASHAANCRRGVNAKLNYDQAADIRRRRAAGERGVDLAREFGVTPQNIAMIARGRTWKVR